MHVEDSLKPEISMLLALETGKDMKIGKKPEVGKDRKKLKIEKT